MQNTVDERKQNGDDFFLSLAVTYFRSGNCPANGLVTEQPQYSVAICFFTTWQNTETMLISNGLRFIFICSLSLALPCIFHDSRQKTVIVIVIMAGTASFPNSLKHKPRRFLRYSNFLGKLHGANTLSGSHY